MFVKQSYFYFQEKKICHVNRVKRKGQIQLEKLVSMN